MIRAPPHSWHKKTAEENAKVKSCANAGCCVLLIWASDESIGQCFRIRKGQTHRKVATQSHRSKEPRLYDSGTAVIQSFHRTAAASRPWLEGEQVMLTYDSNV